MSEILTEKRCLYDLGIKDPWRKAFQYPLAALFLVDFFVTWPLNRSVLGGDSSTNISSGLALFSGLIGKILALFGGKEDGD